MPQGNDYNSSTIENETHGTTVRQLHTHLLAVQPSEAARLLEPSEDLLDWVDESDVFVCIAMADIDAGKPGGVVTVVAPGLKAAATTGTPTYYLCPEQVDGPRPERPELVEGLTSSSSTVDSEYGVLKLPIAADEYNAFYSLIASDLHWKLSHGLVDACAEYRSEHARLAFEVDCRAARELKRWLISEGYEPSGARVTVAEHDFHWIRHGWELRRACPKIQAGFQLHIPPLRYESLRQFQRRPEGRGAQDFPMDEIHRGLLGHDLVACQTLRDAEALLEDLALTQQLCAPDKAWLAVDRSRGIVIVDDGDRGRREIGPRRHVRVVALPVSVDVAPLQREARDLIATEQVAEFYAANALEGKRIVTSVGRCDITKNTVTIVEEWGALLDEEGAHRMSNLRNTSVLVVVSPTTREGIKGYDEEVKRLEEAVDSVNSRHRDAKSGPTVVLVGGRGWDHKMVMAHYARHEVIAAILASNLEGMGLAGHELFTAKGAVGRATFVVSEQAGAHAFFPPEAVIGLRTPQQPGVIRTALRTALMMSDADLGATCLAGFEAVASYTARDHTKRFLDAIVTAASRRHDRRYYENAPIHPGDYRPHRGAGTVLQ
jgi:trehalose-6-phosphate synthase